MATHFYTTDAGERATAIQKLGFADEGITGYLVSASRAGDAPFYRALHPATGAHFYTLSIEERDNATNDGGYVGEGIAAHLSPIPLSGLVPFYRAYHAGSNDHFYTADQAEYEHAVQDLGYAAEGVVGYLLPANYPDSIGVFPFYRLFNGTHFYTADPQERQNAIQNLGFTDEGIAAHVTTDLGDSSGPDPFYRACHTASGGHLYTRDIAERDNATRVLGYRAEGIAGYLYGAPFPGTVPLYRVYAAVGDDHFYTRDQSEAASAVAHGYVWEGLSGVAGYLFPSAVDGSEPFYRMYGPESGTRSFHFNLSQMAGWVQVDISSTGTVTYSGHVHNDAFIAEAFGFSIRAVVGQSHSVLVQFSGNVGGTGATPDQRNCYWSQTETRPEVAANFEAIVEADAFHVYESKHGSITGPLEDVGKFLVDWIAGPVVGGLGLVIFVGAEAAGLATGNSVAVSQIISGVLWMKGPSGTLFSLAAEGLAQLGQRRRAITAAEYGWANEEVFDGTLPEAARLVITDTIGGNGQQFTFPEAGGVISVNMGPAAYADPVGTLGEVFLHELTHAWQLQHTPFDVTWMAQELADQLQGSSAYDVGPAGPPFSSFNYEQQAVIVQRWYRNGSKPDDPDYTYIQQNIRTGTP